MVTGSQLHTWGTVMRRRTAGVVSALVAIACAGGCSRETRGHAVPADHGGRRPIAAALLPQLLLEASMIADIMAAPGIRIKRSRSTMLDSTDQFPDRDCLAAWMPVEQSVYADTGWTATHVESLTSRQPDSLVLQAVTRFDSRSAAEAFFDQTARRWEPCGERTFATNKHTRADTTWTFDRVSDVDSTVWMTQHQDDNPGWSCQRAMQVDNNVAIDVLACKLYVSDEAVTIANGIDARLPSV